MSYANTFAKARKEYGLGGGDNFKPKDGENMIRLVSPAVAYQSEYEGRLNTKFIVHIIDRADNAFKTYFMPPSVMRQIAKYQESKEYGFQTEIPPYDITLDVTNAGTREAKYQVIPSRKDSDLTAFELQEIKKLTPVSKIIERLKAKQPKSEYQGEPVEDVSDEDIEEVDKVKPEDQIEIGNAPLI